MLALAAHLDLLDGFLPRLITQIDRDPHSPTYGSCDRGFWMYRLHDFDSGVLQQASLTLAALVSLAEGGAFEGAKNLDAADAPYWRALALAVNRRNVRLLQAGGGYFDEYYPGERSFPATVFGAYSTLKSALLLGQREIVDHPGLLRTAEALVVRQPSPAANQDIAAAAFLALYGQARDWRRAAVVRTVDRLIRNADGTVRCIEYGGVDLGYATVSLNFLAAMVADDSHDAKDVMLQLGRFVGEFVSPQGRLGGEFPSRATAYFLPFGAVVASGADAALAARLGRLEPAAGCAHLDDRYLMHYCLPSIACAALRLFEHGSPRAAETAAAPASWRVVDYRDRGLLAVRRDGDDPRALFIGLNKGGTLQAETATGTLIDCGWRVTRGDETYATCVLDGTPKFEVHTPTDGDVVVTVTAPFARYRTLVASAAKTVILRTIRVLGPTFNTYFKSRLIQNAVPLPGVTLHRRIRLDRQNDRLEIEDRIDGLQPGDLLTPAPAASLRLVPSAKFYQRGEAAAFLRAAEAERETTVKRGFALATLRSAGADEP